MTYPKEPTADQCSKQERLADFEECPAFACWYPQMGGYVGKAVIVLKQTSRIPEDQPAGVDDCFDAYVWHDGEFPFDEEHPDRSPAYIHHCMPSQFVDFGEFIMDKQEELYGREAKE